MKNMKKTLCMLLTLVMIMGMLPMAAFAGNTSSNQTVYFKTVKVYNVKTYEEFKFDVGTAFPVSMSGESYNSVSWTIPQLSAFLAKSSTYKNYTYTMAQSWNSNLYGVYSSGFTGQTGGQKCHQPGSTVEVVTNNPQNKEIIYYVTEFKAGAPVGGDQGGTTNETIEKGTGTRYTFNFTVVYHSNYPSGTDYTVTKNYKIHSATSMYNIFASDLLTYEQCGFGGYTKKAGNQTWYTSAECTKVQGNFNGATIGTIHLYAGWKSAEGGETKQPVTLTYIDRGMQYDKETMPAGTQVAILDCTNTRDGYTFKGWDTSADAETVIREKGETFTINADATLYAVWEKNTVKTTIQTVTLGVHFTKDTKANSTVMPELADVPTDFTLEYSYTDADGEHSGALSYSDARQWLDSATNNCPTLTWDKAGQPLKVKVAEGTSVVITLKESNYLIGDNASEFIWTRSYNPVVTDGTGTITVKYQGYEGERTEYLFNYYKQPDKQPDEPEKVTITVIFVDEEGNPVGSETKEVDKDSEYDVTDETKKIPEGYEPNGDPTGDPTTGTADTDKTIYVPVKTTEGGEEPDPHTHVYIRENDDEWVEEPDCIHNGTAVYVCECGEAQEIRTVPGSALGHDFDDAVWNDNCDTGDDEDCDGHTKTCARCNGKLEGGEQAGVHHYGDWIVDAKATMDDEGEMHRVCKDCGHTETATIPTLDKVTITVQFEDEDGSIVGSGWSDFVELGSDYDVDEKTKDIPENYERDYDREITGDTIGTADEDVVITVPVKKTEVTPDPEPEKVTITIEYVDEDGTVVKTEPKEVEKDSEYDVTAKTKDIPEGYEANGNPTGDPTTGTADSDKTVTVPVKKSGENPGTEPENPTPTPTPGPTPGPGPAPTPTPNDPEEIEIDDPDVPLAGDLELNRVDHFAYVFGYPDGSVRPLGNITREEVATIFYRLLTDASRAIYASESNDFTDVAGSRWSNVAISTLANAGIINGYTDGTFRPAQSITRAEFAAIAARFENVTEGLESPFSDTNGHWAENLIAYSANRGWVTGYEDGTFRPNQAITRAEAMTLINNVLERHVDGEGLHAGAKQWPDNTADSWYYFAVLEATNNHDYERREDTSLIENWTSVTYNQENADNE